MKDVFVLVSNGWRGYYKSKVNRDSDETSQDWTEVLQVTEEAYEENKHLFEDAFVEVGNTAYLDGVTPVEITRVNEDGRIYIRKPGCANDVWVRFKDLHKNLK